MIGDISLLPKDVQEVMLDSEERTKDYENGTLNICICYNSKHEILETIESLAYKRKEGILKNQIKKSEFAEELSLVGRQYRGNDSEIIKPDILIRTSNEIRLSNFLME